VWPAARLRQKWFRQAIAYSIDRRQMTRQLFRTLTPGPRELNSLSFTVQHPSYQAKFAKYTRNTSRVTQEENYDLAIFAWLGTGDPSGQVDVYGIGGGSNWKATGTQR
jgi:ABC-type transport system substrate-binding protein